MISVWAFMGGLFLLVKFRVRGGLGDVPGSGTAVICARDIPFWLVIPMMLLFMTFMFERGWIGGFLLACTAVLVIWIVQRGVCIRGRGQECMRCGFERPEERTQASEVCPECANRWWIKPHPQAQLKRFSTDRLGVRPLGWAGGLGRVRVACVALAVSALLYSGFFGWLRFGNLETLLPSGVLIGMMQDADRHATQDLIEEVFARPGLTQTQADRAMDVLMDRVDAGENPLRYMPDEFENALLGGAFSDAALDRFFVDALKWELETEVLDDGTLRLFLHFEGRARGIWAAPKIVPCRVRLNDGPWILLSGDEFEAHRIAMTFVDRAGVDEDGSGVTDETDERFAEMDRPGLEPLDGSAMGPGEHTVTLLLYETVTNSRAAGWVAHSYLDPEGRPIPHPREVWGEEVELTATFTIPEDAP